MKYISTQINCTMESFLTSLLPIEVLSAKSVLAPRFDPRTSDSKANTIPLHKRVWPKSAEKSPPSLHYCNKGCILPTCLNLNLPPISHLEVLKWTKLEQVCSLDPPLDVTSRRAGTRRQGGGPSTLTGGGGQEQDLYSEVQFIMGSDHYALRLTDNQFNIK